ncbi:MAG: MotA/TolQ/ExbB proton channel family protein [Planctomycetes bacterium]|nr:MotA/TolQ/ExbB proton channel family protein [Planctomycetota bacterium]
MLPFPSPQQAPNVIATIGEFFDAGGLLMWPILLCSVVVVGLALERYLSLRRARVVPRVVLDAAQQVVEGRADVIEAGILAASAPAARVLAAGLRRRGCLLADVEKAMEDRLHEEARLLRGNSKGIVLVATIAPLLGLLGTVLGIADAFAAVEQTGLGKSESSEALAAGIKVALYTTIFGLFVAIPATLVAAHLQARARRLAAAIAQAVQPTVVALAALPPSARLPREHDEPAADPKEHHAA